MLEYNHFPTDYIQKNIQMVSTCFHHHSNCQVCLVMHASAETSAGPNEPLVKDRLAKLNCCHGPCMLTVSATKEQALFLYM